MARLERSSLTRWEDGKPVTYHKGDDVPDYKPGGDPEKPNVFLTREEGGAKAGKTKLARAKAEVPEAPEAEDADLDIIQILEGNVTSVVSWVKEQTEIDTLESALVAEGEGKNRSTITAAINEHIKFLEGA